MRVGVLASSVVVLSLAFMGCAAEAAPDEDLGTAEGAVTVGAAGTDVQEEGAWLHDPTLTKTRDFDRDNLFIAGEGQFANRDVVEVPTIYVPRLERSRNSLRPADGTPQDGYKPWGAK